MRRLVFALLVGVLLHLAGVSTALAEEYTVKLTVDGKPVTLTVSIDTDGLAVNPDTPSVRIIAVEQIKLPSATQIRAEQQTVNRNANLRAGPGTTFAVAGSAKVGDVVTVVGTNAGGDWYQLSTGEWIAAFLVNRGPATQVRINPTPVPTVPPAPTTAPTPVPQAQTQAQNCDPSYPTLCIPPNAPDLNCGDISARRFQVLQPDPHRFDGDRDGIGCES